MNACSESMNGNISIKPKAAKNDWILYLLVIPFLIPAFFMPIYGLFAMATVGWAMMLEQKTRRHGAILFFSTIYVLIGTLLASNFKFFWLIAYGRVINGFGLFLLYYLPDSTPRLLLMLAYFWCALIAPFVFIETFYWLWHCGKKYFFAGTILLISITGYFLYYENQCKENFIALEAYQGQTLPAQDLWDRVGKPIYKTSHAGPMHLRPHWVYSNGDFAIPVTVDSSGMATVHEAKYIFFD